MTRYVLTLEPKPGIDDTRALRAALKALGRRFGLRCVEIRQLGAMDGCKHPECQEAELIARKRAPVRKIAIEDVPWHLLTKTHQRAP